MKDHLSGRVEYGCHPGPKPYLHHDEEGELTTYLLKATSIGLGKTRHEVMRIAEGVAAQKGILKGSKISCGWGQRFCARNPGVSLRSGDATAGIHIDAVNEENMLQCFSLLREVYDDLHVDYDGHPERIYNNNG